MRSSDVVLSFKHNIFYTNHGPVPAQQVAEALLALDSIVQRTPKIFQKLVPGTKLPKAKLFVEKLQEGSLEEDVIVNFFFGSKDDMEKTIKGWRDYLGVDLTKKTGVIRTLIIIILLVGAYEAMSHFGHGEAKPSIEIKDNVIINVGAKEMNMTPEDLVNLVQTATTRKSTLAKDAVKVIVPAKSDAKGSIQLDGDSKLSIPTAVISAVPSEVSDNSPTKSETLQHAEVHLRALDLDSSDKGWAAVVPQKSQRRLKLELDPQINAESLYGEKVITGTVEVLSKKDAHDHFEVTKYRLISRDKP